MTDKKRVLDRNEKNWIIDDTLAARPIDSSLKKVDMDRREFTQYLKQDPEFDLELQQAEKDACRFLANDLINADKLADHPKMAAVISNNILRVLAANLPEKYGNKLDLNLNAQVSIKGNLAESNNRVLNMVRDVTPQLIATGITDSFKVNK
jgi:hypothetical protein